MVDEKTHQAQERNAEQMTDAYLLDEFRRVTGLPEQPPIRVAWIEVLRNEIAGRGLQVPSL